MGGAAGDGMTKVCYEEWVCSPWSTCRNVERSYDSKVISREDHYKYKKACEEAGYSDERFCGFQFTVCRDINFCNNSKPRNERPEVIKSCYFTENPSCFDGITNCHDGDCEILTDCGGPCPPCPTCSDGIQNGGEEGIDCGGPCPYPCRKEEPLTFSSWLLILIAIILFILFMIIGWRIMKIHKYRVEIERQRRKREWRRKLD